MPTPPSPRRRPCKPRTPHTSHHPQPHDLARTHARTPYRTSQPPPNQINTRRHPRHPQGLTPPSAPSGRAFGPGYVTKPSHAMPPANPRPRHRPLDTTPPDSTRTRARPYRPTLDHRRITTLTHEERAARTHHQRHPAHAANPTIGAQHGTPHDRTPKPSTTHYSPCAPSTYTRAASTNTPHTSRTQRQSCVSSTTTSTTNTQGHTLTICHPLYASLATPSTPARPCAPPRAGHGPTPSTQPSYAPLSTLCDPHAPPTHRDTETWQMRCGLTPTPPLDNAAAPQADTTRTTPPHHTTRRTESVRHQLRGHDHTRPSCESHSASATSYANGSPGPVEKPTTQAQHQPTSPADSDAPRRPRNSPNNVQRKAAPSDASTTSATASTTSRAYATHASAHSTYNKPAHHVTYSPWRRPTATTRRRDGHGRGTGSGAPALSGHPAHTPTPRHPPPHQRTPNRTPTQTHPPNRL